MVGWYYDSTVSQLYLDHLLVSTNILSSSTLTNSFTERENGWLVAFNVEDLKGKDKFDYQALWVINDWALKILKVLHNGESLYYIIARGRIT